ncbi:MAG: MtrB/PioB family outer membrane beta-barrel protein [Gammaproteobacteria bacterium]|nr:MtrB/PioB family outer membrane beta-barrel protein [Gammaproteobacteria bacterium]
MNMRPLSPILLLLAGTFFNTAQATGLEGELSVGLINFDIDHPNTVVGQYNGVSDNAQKLLAEFDFNIYSENKYLHLDGDNLGLDTHQLGLNWGECGLFELSFQHRQITRFSGVNALTPFDGVGSDQLTLPNGFTPGVTPGDMSLAEYLKPIDLATQRNRNRLELVLTPGENWSARIAFFREKRSGSEALGGVVGIPRRSDNYPLIILPAPVDQSTENIEGTLGYQDPTTQWELNYQWSHFSNKDTTLTWDNPYNGRSDYPQQAAISLNPDNSYYNLGLSGALNFAPRTRLVVAANMGKMRQDSTMLAYTINPDTLITDPLTRSSTQAEVETRRLHLKLSSKPLRRLSLNLGYNYDRSRNNTPVDLFQRVVNDTGEVGGTAQSSIDSSRANYNRSYQKRRSRLKLDSRYYFGRGTSLKIALFQEEIERSQRAVKETREQGSTPDLTAA